MLKILSTLWQSFLSLFAAESLEEETTASSPVELPKITTVTQPVARIVPERPPKPRLPIDWQAESDLPKLLIVEDGINVIEFYLSAIKRMGLQVNIAAVDTAAEAIELLTNNEVAYAILDGSIKEGDGVDVIEYIRATGKNVIAIAASGSTIGNLLLLRLGCNTSVIDDPDFIRFNEPEKISAQEWRDADKGVNESNGHCAKGNAIEVLKKLVSSA